MLGNAEVSLNRLSESARPDFSRFGGTFRTVENGRYAKSTKGVFNSTSKVIIIMGFYFERNY